MRKNKTKGEEKKKKRREKKKKKKKKRKKKSCEVTKLDHLQRWIFTSFVSEDLRCFMGI